LIDWMIPVRHDRDRHPATVVQRVQVDSLSVLQVGGFSASTVPNNVFVMLGATLGRAEDRPRPAPPWADENDGKRGEPSEVRRPAESASRNVTWHGTLLESGTLRQASPDDRVGQSAERATAELIAAQGCPRALHASSAGIGACTGRSNDRLLHVEGVVMPVST
jgi:hypothetical protein